MPKRLFYYRFINHYRIWQEDRLDFIYYTIPWEPVTWQYHFPGEYVGQYGVYEAIKGLYSRDPSTAHLIRPESLLISRETFASTTETIVERVRKRFRATHQISESAITIFVAPGNEKTEAEFCLEECRLGVEEFRRKFFAPTSLEPRALPTSELTTVLSIQKGSTSALLSPRHRQLRAVHQGVPEDPQMALQVDNSRGLRDRAPGRHVCTLNQDWI
jgi:hypothetical protein